MATIEPRLIHLLNESTATPRPHHTELPPIKGLGIANAYPHHPPHPIEPISNPQQQQQQQQQQPPPPPPPQASAIPFIYAPGPDEGSFLSAPATAPVHAAGSASDARKDASHQPGERPPPGNNSSQDPRIQRIQDLLIFDESPDGTEDTANKKRAAVKDDFVQLPQPLKKQKANVQQQQQVRYPPMIVGLYEPPMSNNSPRFPPISSDRPHSEPPQVPTSPVAPQDAPVSKPDEAALSAAPPAAQTTPTTPDPERTMTGKARQRRAPKPRRKWTESETNHLLLGVSKHGVGRWTDILEDPDYTFNDRSAGDLKDRFRTCCPEELRATLLAKKAAASQMPAAPSPPLTDKPKKGLMSENILNETEEDAEGEKQSPVGDVDASSKQPRKSRAHRKNMEDLVNLGIKGPFKKSHRRERKPFSEQDDKEIVEGFKLYGPQWTKIQRDPRFNLVNRQPTDLRDRLRNKFPAMINTASERAPNSGSSKETGRGGNQVESHGATIDLERSAPGTKATPSEPRLHRTSNFRDDIQSQPQSSIYWNESGGVSFASNVMGEMDISRLLLDDGNTA